MAELDWQFDEHSLEDADNIKHKEVTITNSETKEERTLIIPNVEEQ